MDSSSAGSRYRKRLTKVFLDSQDEVDLWRQLKNRFPELVLIDTASYYGEAPPELAAPLEGRTVGIWNRQIFATLDVRSRSDGSKWCDDPHALILWGGSRVVDGDVMEVGWWSTAPSKGDSDRDIEFRRFVSACWRILERNVSRDLVARTRAGVIPVPSERVGASARASAAGGHLQLRDMQLRLYVGDA